MIGWLIFGVYVAGVVYTSPRFARTMLERYRSVYPRPHATVGEIAATRREYAWWGLLNGIFWPLMGAFALMVNAIHDRAYAKDLAAERELERAELYAKARRITRQNELEEEAHARRKFSKELDS